MADPPAAGTTDPTVIAIDFTRQVVDRQTMRWALQKLTGTRTRDSAASLLRRMEPSGTARAMGVKTGTVKHYAADGLSKLYQAHTGTNSAAT